MLTFDNRQCTVLSETDTTPPAPAMMRPPTPRPHPEDLAVPSDVLRGTLDLLILKALSLEPMHGWGVAQRLEQLSGDVLSVGQGSLYPALQRLEEKGWIDSDWRLTEQNRRAKYYELTPAGRRALGEAADSWRRYALMVEAILATVAEGAR